jgi:hypothetical protein
MLRRAAPRLPPSPAAGPGGRQPPFEIVSHTGLRLDRLLFRFVVTAPGNLVGSGETLTQLVHRLFGEGAKFPQPPIQSSAGLFPGLRREQQAQSQPQQESKQHRLDRAALAFDVDHAALIEINISHRFYS